MREDEICTVEINIDVVKPRFEEDVEQGLRRRTEVLF